ncbi:MAG: calcium/sodium antiporter [bacterium]
MDIAVGNVVGSNIFNVFFILGLCSLITPLVVHPQIIRLDVPIMVGVSLLLWVLSLDGRISRTDGILLLSGIALYTVFAIRQSRKESHETQSEFQNLPPLQRSMKNYLTSLLMILGGLAFLIYGSKVFVQGAVMLAQRMGVSELVIGLTVVAAGTSLPEVITSLIAAFRGQRDIAVGNVVGSNIYNILAILGFSGIMAREGVPVSEAVLGFDIPVMIGAALACLPIFFTGHRISRVEGVLFLFLCLAYNVFLILKSSEHDALHLYNHWMLSFVLPLLFATLLISFVRSLATMGKWVKPPSAL